ncbi:MAG: hypothetical protein LBD97_07025 [Bifidobacteriaceae bacterium]|nr:hypothetical protein [Bifidobacteriaceae bacterium]
MADRAASELLAGLIASWENEVVEFKQAGQDFKTDRARLTHQGRVTRAGLLLAGRPSRRGTSARIRPS